MLWAVVTVNVAESGVFSYGGHNVVGFWGSPEKSGDAKLHVHF